MLMKSWKQKIDKLVSKWITVGVELDKFSIAKRGTEWEPARNRIRFQLS